MAEKSQATRKRAEGNQPEWVNDVIRIVARHEAIPEEHYPLIQWRFGTKHRTTSGVTYHAAYDHTKNYGMPQQYGTRIVITAGYEPIDQALVLLHELAHYVLPHHHAHDATFWRKAWSFYERYGIPLEYAYERELRYRWEAMWTCKELELPIDPAFAQAAELRHIRNKPFVHFDPAVHPFRDKGLPWGFMLGYDED